MIAWLAGLAVAADVPMTGYAGHPWTLGRGHAVFGLFRPATFGVSDAVDVTIPGLATLVAPRADLKVTAAQSDAAAVAFQGGVGVPTPGLALLRSTATVLSTDPQQAVGFGAVFDVGVIGGLRRGPLLTSVGAELRAGASSGELQPQGLWWVDPMLAPLTEGPVVRMRWVTDLAATERVNLTGEWIVQAGSGSGPDLGLRGLALLAPSDHVAIGLGWAFARETFSYGVDTFGMPLLDVQGRL